MWMVEYFQADGPYWVCVFSSPDKFAAERAYDEAVIRYAKEDCRLILVEREYDGSY